MDSLAMTGSDGCDGPVRRPGSLGGANDEERLTSRWVGGLREDRRGAAAGPQRPGGGCRTTTNHVHRRPRDATRRLPGP